MDAHRLASSYWGLLLAVAVTAVLQTVLVVRSPTITADGIIFARISEDLASEPVEALRKYDQHPGYPAMMLAGTRVMGALGYHSQPEAWMAGGQAIGFVCGLLSVCVVWLFARDLFDVRIANIAAFIFAILPVPRYNAADALSDTAHVLFYLLGAWLVCTAMLRNSIPRLMGAGLAAGTAYWIRPEGLEIVVVGLACVAGYGWYSGWGLRRVALATGALAGMALVVAVPYMVLAGKLTSKQLPFAKNEPTTTYIEQMAEQAAATTPPPAAPATDADVAVAPVAVEPPAPAVEAVPQTPPPAVEVAAATPPPTDPAPELQAVVVAAAPVVPTKRNSWALFVKVMRKAVWAFVASICQGFKWAFLPMYLVGNIELWRRKPNWGPVIFVALLGALHILVLHSVFVMSGYIAHRHVLPLVALAMPFTALGVVYVSERLPRPALFGASFPELATLTVCTAIVLPYTLMPFSREFVPVIDATRWVSEHAPPEAGVISNSPYTGFYGTHPTALLEPACATLEDVVRKSHSETPFDFVVLHVNAHDYRPEWLSMISQSYTQVAEFPGLEVRTNRPQKVLVFESKRSQAQTQRPAPRS